MLAGSMVIYGVADFSKIRCDDLYRIEPPWRSSMVVNSYVPQWPLSNFVDLFWSCERCTRPVKERVLPTGTVELVLDLREAGHRNDFQGSTICGPHSDVFVIDSAQDESMIGVHFKPGGAYPFVRVPMRELQNACVPLKVLWGATAARLRDRLLDTETSEARFRILEDSLMTQLARSMELPPSVAFALEQFQRLPRKRCSEVVDQIGISQRHFTRVFHDVVGLTPKLFHRVQRFQKVLRLIANGRPAWIEIALACGYYDQAHFINDFKTFSGFEPTAYVSRWRGVGNPNHLSVAD
jgi:AraC-like DNA-binding protein